jgi:anti-sigma B factor antagonist
MVIDVESYKRVDLITVAGRVDGNSAQQLDEALSARLSNGQSNLIVNLSGIDFMGSAGLRALLAAYKEAGRRGGRLVLAAPSKRVSEVFTLAAIHHIFTIYEDNLSAIASF